MREMVLSLSGFDIAAFCPPVPLQLKGSTHQRTFDIHFGVFVKVMEVMIGFGSQQASAVSKSRTQALLVDLHKKQALVSTYMNYHDIELSEDRVIVRARTIADANKYLLTFRRELHDTAMTLKLMHPFAPPANGTGSAIRPPLFTPREPRGRRQHAKPRSTDGHQPHDVHRIYRNREIERGNKHITSPSHFSAATSLRSIDVRSRAYRIGKCRQTCTNAWRRQEWDRLTNNGTYNYHHNGRHSNIQQLPPGPPPSPPGPPPARPLPPSAPSVAPAATMQGSRRHASSPNIAEENEAAPERTDGASPESQRGRPERGEARELRFPCLQMRASPWVWQERPNQGRCHHICFSVRKSNLEAKKGQTSW